MSDIEADDDYDSLVENDIQIEQDDGEGEEQLTRVRGDGIYAGMSEDNLRKQTLELLEEYIKQKSNRKIAEQEIYEASLSEDKTLNKELYIQLVTAFATEILQYGLKQAYESLVENTLQWSHPIFKDIKDYEDKEVAKRLKPIEIKEGIYQCTKCKGKRTQSYEVQLRRADEPATVFIECVNPKCRHKWSIN
jgi:DNA-directed RNA polymerase subunit M/transcription elongation factor TFIIS